MLQHSNTTSRRSWLIDLACLAGLFLFFYTCWLGSYPVFTPDEGRYPEVAREMIMTGDFITPRVDGVAFLDKPILYYWLQAAAIGLFGVAEWVLRLFPSLFGVFGCLMTYVAGRRLFDRRTGLLSAILLATTPLYFAGAHYANLDLEVAVLITTTLLFFVMATQSQGRTQTACFFAAYVFAALAFLTKGLIAVAFPGMIGGLWIALTGRWALFKRMHLIKGIGLFLLIVLPWYVLVQRANPDFLHYFFVTQQVTRFLSAGEFNNKTPFWFYAPIVLLGFFPWTIFLGQSLARALRLVWRERLKHQSLLFLLLWFGVVFAFFSIPRSKTIGYILPVFPALALLTGHYLSSQWDNAKRHLASVVLFIVFSAIITISLLTAQRHQWNDIPPAFTPYLYAIIGLCVLSSIGMLFTLNKKSLRSIVVICTVCSTLFLFALLLGASHLNRNSSKPLTTYLKTIIKPQDEVVNYFKYFYDVPLYLGQRVTIVADWHAPDVIYNDNWTREMWYGMSFQPTNEWLIEETDFWQRWESKKRVFVFVSANYFDQFKRQAKSYYRLAEYNDIVLVSNQL